MPSLSGSWLLRKISLSPIAIRRLSNFKANRRGYISFWIFLVLFTISLFAELIANDKPIIISYDSKIYFPIIETYSETKFGGDFEVKSTSNPKKLVKEWAGKIIHLTMFGISIDDEIINIKENNEDILFIVGAEKVPPWVFELSDYNIAIGNSEGMISNKNVSA